MSFVENVTFFLVVFVEALALVGISVCLGGDLVKRRLHLAEIARLKLVSLEEELADESSVTEFVEMTEFSSRLFSPPSLIVAGGFLSADLS